MGSGATFEGGQVRRPMAPLGEQWLGVGSLGQLRRPRGPGAGQWKRAHRSVRGLGTLSQLSPLQLRCHWPSPGCLVHGDFWGVSEPGDGQGSVPPRKAVTHDGSSSACGQAAISLLSPVKIMT